MPTDPFKCPRCLLALDLSDVPQTGWLICPECRGYIRLPVTQALQSPVPLADVLAELPYLRDAVQKATAHIVTRPVQDAPPHPVLPPAELAPAKVERPPPQRKEPQKAEPPPHAPVRGVTAEVEAEPSSLAWARVSCSSCRGVVLILGTKKPKGDALCFRCSQERRARAQGHSTSASSATASRPILTADHRCLQCRYPLRRRGEEGFGVAHRTFHHDECLRLTDVYASVYYCPGCVRHPTLLESPKAQWGQSTTCPTCATTFVVPSDAPFREVDPQRVEGRHFSFLCPSCAGPLECNVRHAGALAVCLHCRFAIIVPSIGEAAPPEPGRARPRSPGEAIRPIGSGRCPDCGAAVPPGSARCPVCE